MVLCNFCRWCIIFSLPLKNRQLLINFCQLLIFFIINFFLHIGLFEHIVKRFFINLRNRSLNDQFLLLQFLKSSLSFLLHLILLLLQLNLFLCKFFNFVIRLLLGKLTLYLIANLLYFKIGCLNLVKTLLHFAFLLK